MPTIEPGSEGSGPLSPYRVLDLCGEMGMLAGKILADMGAEVIAVEPPEGNPARRVGPFYDDTPDPERSLVWWAWAGGKRSVTLDIASESGVGKLKDLVADSDFLLEGFAPGYMDKQGLGYETLRAINPSLVMVSMTPFGQTGPYSRFQGPDLVGMAMGGLSFLTGDADRPPLRVTQPQFGALAGASGAIGAMVAHYHRLKTGQGQHVDVSGQQSVARVLSEAAISWGLNHINVVRLGIYRGMGGERRLRNTWTCKDGFVSFFVTGGVLGARTNALFEWMADEGFELRPDARFDWHEIDAGKLSDEVLESIEGAMAAFFLTHTKRELYQGAFDRGILMFPVANAEDAFSDPQLSERNFFIEIDHPEEDRSFRYPGAFIKSTASYLGPRRRAPLLGEDNGEVLGERGGSRNGKPRAGQCMKTQPFEGLKVLDFCWVGIGPLTTRYLSDHGATVVRVESLRRVEVLRTASPFADGIPGINRSGYFTNYNSNKLGVSIDFSNPEAKKVIHRLVRWADVVTENFSPGTLERYSLGYEDLKAIKPDIVMYSASMLGRGGPYDRQAGFGPMLGSLAGFVHHCGWPDRTPVPPYGAYTDFFLARFGASALIAALDYRERTGQGQYLDFSQLEGALQVLAPALLDYSANGREQERDGNRSRAAAPHAVYPCKEPDTWCAITVETDEQWQALVSAMGGPEWAGDPNLEHFPERKANEEKIDDLISEWTRNFEPVPLMEMLQGAGVPAGAVNSCENLFSDKQLAHRGHYVWMDHPEMGQHPFDGTEFICSATPALYKTPSPMLGQHNEYVLKEVLRMTDDEIGDLAASGVLY